MPLDDVYEYFRSYDRASFAVFACKGNEPSEQDIIAFEKVIGFRLPEEFREFTMSGLGGLYMEVREELWPRAKEFEVGPFWSFLYGIAVFGISKEIPDWLDIREQHREFREWGITDLVPFLRVMDDSNRYCFDRAGRIIHWDHELQEKREEVPLTFSELLMREIHELEQRKERKVRGKVD